MVFDLRKKRSLYWPIETSVHWHDDLVDEAEFIMCEKIDPTSYCMVRWSFFDNQMPRKLTLYASPQSSSSSISMMANEAINQMSSCRMKQRYCKNASV